MPTYIEMSNCKGIRPGGVVGLHHSLRPDITGAMLRDRAVPRFLVAPTGYGKSSCAFEYAQVVFDFEHVFWLKCDSPCFLRDLDLGTIASQIAHADDAAKLVVFDDVPHLDQGRVDAFDMLLGELMESGIEIVFTCVPSADAVSSRYVDKILLCARDLIPTEDEVEIERMRGSLSREEAQALLPPKGAACLLWGEGGIEQILRGLADEEMPGELELAIFAMLVLESGRVDELGSILAVSRLEEDASYLASMFPYLGIDIDAGTFDCPSASPADILRHSKLSPAMLARASLQGEREGLAMELADMLMAKGDGSRAADLLMALGTQATRTRWVLEHGWELLCYGYALPAEHLASGAKALEAGERDPLIALRSWALAMLGDESESARMAMRLTTSPSLGWCEVAAAAIAGSVFGPKGDEEAIKSNISHAWGLRNALGGDVKASSSQGSSFIDWDAMLELECLRFDEADEMRYVDRFEVLARKPSASMAGSIQDPLRNAILVSGSWFLGKHADEVRAGNAASARPAGCAEIVAKILRQKLESAQQAKALTWPECLAVDALQTLSELYPYAFDERVPLKMVSIARSMAIDLMMQADRHRRDAAIEEEAKGEYELTHHDILRGNAQPASKVASLRVATPPLVVSLFGGAEAWIGTDGTDPRQIKRKNAKIALAMLVLHRGREVTKEKMENVLWPEATAEAARQNLYVIWSYLKRMLKVGSSCPYLISTQTGYKLDVRYVASDTQRFEELCRDLLFGHHDKDVWEELYEKVSGDFAEDLMPEIAGNTYIDAMRSRFRTQIVDGLVEASARMGREGESRGALWFAREALRRDRSREDVYIALMEAQIASSQRGAALDTYFECRRYLSEQLGIDPSKRVVDLYRSIIETEEDF